MRGTVSVPRKIIIIYRAGRAPTATPSATSLLSSLVPLKQGDNSNAIDEFCCEWSREAPRLWCRVGHKSQNESINKQSKNGHKTRGQYQGRPMPLHCCGLIIHVFWCCVLRNGELIYPPENTSRRFRLYGRGSSGLKFVKRINTSIFTIRILIIHGIFALLNMRLMRNTITTFIKDDE